MSDLPETGDKQVFISYSHHDLELVRKLRNGLHQFGISTFVATDDVEVGHPIIDSIVDGVYKSKKCLFLVTKAAMKSSWFAFETILSLEWSQQLGKIGCIILLYNVSPEELPYFELFSMMPKFTLTLDSEGNWTQDQVIQVVDKIKEETKIDSALPVGNVAHAQAWSHFFGFHNIIHEYLKERIVASPFYQENPANFPIVVYELVPRSCKISFNISDENVQKVGALDPIIVNRAGNKSRPYCLNVYCIEDDGQKYYCIAQYPNVISAIWKMEQAQEIDMDSKQKEMQRARFIYTMNAILHHNTNAKCNEQTRLLDFDDSVENPRDVLLRAIKRDVERTSLDSKSDTFQKPPKEMTGQQKEHDAAIIHSRNTNDKDRAREVEEYLMASNAKLLKQNLEDSLLKRIEEASMKCKWLILIITKDGLQDAVFHFATLSLIQHCVESGGVSVIPVVEDPTHIPMLDILRWVTYVDMRTEGYQDRICRTLRGTDTPVALDAAYLPAGNIGYGLAWGFVVNYIKTVLSQFGPYLQSVFELKGDDKCLCPEKIYLLVPSSCKCTGLVSDRWNYVQHFNSFARINSNLGGANVIKTLDIYSIEDSDTSQPKKHYFIGQYPAPVLCLWEMNNCGIAGIKHDSMKREAKRFCETFDSLMRGVYGDGLHTKCEIVHFDDSDPEDLRKQLIPILLRDSK